MRRIHADLLLLLAAAVWGLAFVFQKTAMSHLGPLLFVGMRSLVAALALMPLAILEARRSGQWLNRGLGPVSVLGGVAFFVAAFLQQWGIVTATVTNAGFLTALYVVVTPFLIWLLLRRQPLFVVWPAAVLSFVGTWLLAGGGIAAFSSGDLLIALSAVFWAGHVVITSEASRHGRPVTFTTLQFVVVAALGLAGALAFEPVSLTAIRAAWVEIAFVGILSSALTFTLLAVAMRHTPPAEAAVIVSTETLFAALAAYLMLGERLGLVAWTGAGMILIAVLLVQLGPIMQRRPLVPGESEVAERPEGGSVAPPRRD